jgi:hypothetical protein
MTVERAGFVRLSASPEIETLLRDIRGAHARANKALPGDRTDVVRYEALCTRLESIAQAALACGAATAELPVDDMDALIFADSTMSRPVPEQVVGILQRWVSDGAVAVELRLPFTPGITSHRQAAELLPAAPSAPWAAPAGIEGRRAVELRFRRQLTDVLAETPAAIVMPSGVSNSVLTEVLREFVVMTGRRVDAPVTYRDGSRAAPFPLRALSLLSDPPVSRYHELRLALLSVRHPEMDVEVDGAWLRNTDISRPRAAGETDQLAFEVSRRQLSQLCVGDPLLIRLYQTGLEPAVVGFYRAVAMQLIERPGSLAVVPMYFRRQSQTQASRQVAEYSQQTYFSQGTPWAT